MHEFTSISVSSYDAASLADKLTEKSAAGWDVVAIVPAGTNITAYLSREADAAGQAPTSDTGAEDSTSSTPDEAAASASTAAVTTPTNVAHEVEEPAPVWEPEPVAEEPAAVEEPAGWAVAPEPASPSPASVGVAEASPEPAPYVDSSSGDSASQPASEATSGYVDEPRLGSTTAGYDTGSTGYDTGTSSGAAADSAPSTGYDTAASTGYDSGAAADSAPSTGYDTGTTTESATVETGAGSTTESATVASSAESTAAAEQTTAAAASAAPAGWYADPSGRYELRYWDGTQWTEHVSRAGQQYTDPPVA